MIPPHVQYHDGAYATAMTSVATTSRELDSRSSDGIDVRLLWDPRSGQVSVAVNDTKNGGAFELPVYDGQRALDVFLHPYAYAAQAPLSARA